MASTGEATCGRWKVERLAGSDPDVAAFLAHQQAALAEAQAHAQAQRARADEWYWLWLEDHEDEPDPAVPFGWHSYETEIRP